MRRVAFVGCRDWTDAEAIRDELVSAEAWAPIVVVTGDASGADHLAALIAETELGLEVVRHEADWDRLGRRAGPERNARIVADSDEVVAFWDGRSPGTRDCITQAVQAGKPVRIVPRTP